MGRVGAIAHPAWAATPKHFAPRIGKNVCPCGICPDKKSELPPIVALVEPDQAFLDALQVNRHLVHRLEALGLSLRIVQFAEGGMDLHELKGDLFTGFLNLLNGGGAFHERDVV
jgi:hypothetical protein